MSVDTHGVTSETTGHTTGYTTGHTTGHETENFTDPVTGAYVGPTFDSHDKQYFLIFAILLALTATEVALSYSGLKHGSLAGTLMVLAAIKFVLVAAYFMHLKFDTPVFRRFFVGGGVLAGFCYTAVLSATGALRTPRAGLPVHWWIYLAGAIVMLAVWVVPNPNRHDDDHAGHDHDDHEHADHEHAGHAHSH